MLKALKNVFGFRQPRADGSAPIQPAQADAIDLQKAPPPDHFRLGNAAVQADNYAEAAEHYARFVAAEPANASGHVGLGFALVQLGRFSEAIETLNQAVTHDPKSGDGFFLLGQACLGLGQPQAAMHAWGKAHALAPELEHLYCDYCLLLFNHGQADQALGLMRTGVQRFPANADFKFYLGNLLAERADYASAAEAYREAVALNPDSPHLLSSYATALMQIGERDAAAVVLKKAMDLAPDAAAIFSNYLLCIQYGGAISREDKLQAALEFSTRFETPLMGEWGNWHRFDSHVRKLRLGYVSGDFRNHALASFIEPILLHHDKSRFELHCYYTHPVVDEVTQRIAGLADRWISCHDMSDADLAARIRADEIDVLVDLSGHTGHNRLLTFARKPAPVQMTWLGYQATTGLRAMDYRVTEESLDPTGTSERFHSEKLIRLPSSGTFSPSPESPPVNELPFLSGQPFTFGCLNNPTKITDDAIAVWAEILQRSPGARLLLGNATAPLVERISAQFAQCGVAPSRLVFQPKLGLADYLGLHHQIDVGLDTFPYNGGTTTFHSIWMGVPLIALDGDTALSKVGAGIMRGLGLPQFCAETREQYVERAVHFHAHFQELADVRGALRGKLDAINKQMAIDVTRWLESAMQACWQDRLGHPTATGVNFQA